MVWVRERMDVYRIARRVLMANVSGGQVRGRPKLGWMDGVKMALSSRGMAVEAGVQSPGAYVDDRVFNVAIFAWPCVLSDRPSALWWTDTWRGIRCHYIMRLGLTY